MTMLAFVDLEERVPADHPLRAIKALADGALTRLSPEFDRMYADMGRPSIPPERLLKASLLIALYSVRSERAFCEELDYNLAVPLVPGHATDGAQLRSHGVHQEPAAATEAPSGPAAVRRGGCGGGSAKPFVGRALHAGRHADRGGSGPQELQATRRRPAPGRRRPGRPPGGLSWEAPNQRHAPEHDGPRGETLPEGQGGKEARLVFMAHALMENRNGLLVDFLVREATGMAERDAVPVLLAGARERGFQSPDPRRGQGATARGGPCAPAGFHPRTWRKHKAISSSELRKAGIA